MSAVMYSTYRCFCTRGPRPSPRKRVWPCAIKVLKAHVSTSDVVCMHITRNNTPIHNILSTAPQLSISQKAP
jgi:hypothetical protein